MQLQPPEDLLPDMDYQRPFSQGNAQSDYMNMQPKSNRLISNQINNIQNQYNHYNQIIVANKDDLVAMKRSNKEPKVGSGLEHSSYRKYNNLNEFAQNTYANFDEFNNDNFIINDDGSQSANMMMLDGEYDPLING